MPLLFLLLREYCNVDRKMSTRNLVVGSDCTKNVGFFHINSNFITCVIVDSDDVYQSYDILPRGLAIRLA